MSPNDPFEFLNSHLPVSRETYEKLKIYHELLLKWQAKINLVGPDTVADAWARHFLDSLQLVKLLPNTEAKIMDIGTGAGFPGLVLAVFGYKNIHLVESDVRKATFLREVARATGTEVAIYNKRVEDVSRETEMDIIVSRACSPLSKLLSYSAPFVSRETNCLFHKGKNYIMELEDAKLHWQFEVAITPSVVDGQGAILAISHIGEQPNDQQNRSKKT